MTPTPCARVPVHPKFGRLWGNMQAVGSETPLPSYPLDDLFDQSAIDSAVAAEREQWKALHAAVDALMAAAGCHGAVNARDDRAQRVMDALYAMDGPTLGRTEAVAAERERLRLRLRQSLRNRYCRAGMCVATDADHEAGCRAQIGEAMP